MTQLAFDLDLPKVTTAFPTMQTATNGGRCSSCLRLLKGHYSRCHGALNQLGWFAWCDDCTDERRNS